MLHTIYISLLFRTVSIEINCVSKETHAMAYKVINWKSERHLCTVPLSLHFYFLQLPVVTGPQPASLCKLNKSMSINGYVSLLLGVITPDPLQHSSLLPQQLVPLYACKAGRGGERVQRSFIQALWNKSDTKPYSEMLCKRKIVG